MKIGRRGATLAFAAAVFSGCARAGDGSGPVNDTAGVALHGYDPDAYVVDRKAVPGSPEFGVVWQGMPYRFATAAHRAMFIAEPARFMPEFGGFCALAAAYDDKATIEPQAFDIVGDRLYVLHSMRALEAWRRDIPGNIARAQKNWPHTQTLPGVSH